MILDHKKLLISSCAGLGDFIMFTSVDTCVEKGIFDAKNNVIKIFKSF